MITLVLLVTAMTVMGATWAALRWQRTPPATGAEAIPYREAVVDSWEGEEGWVILDGERWRARSENALAPGDRVDVLSQHGLSLEVGWARRRLESR